MTDIFSQNTQAKTSRIEENCPVCGNDTSDRRFTLVKCVKCTGWVHVSKCTDLKPVDLQRKELMNQFKCRTCDDDETFEDESMEGVAADAQRDNSAIMCKILHELKSLRKESLEFRKVIFQVEKLRIENAELKKAIVDLSNNYKRSHAPLPPSSRQAIISQQQPLAQRGRSPFRRNGEVRFEQPTKSPAKYDITRRRSRSSDTRMKRPEQKTLRVVKQSASTSNVFPRNNVRLIKTKAMVVVRDTDIDSKGIGDHLIKCGIAVDKIVMLKQKAPHYRTFVIEGNDVSIDCLFDENLWDEGCLVKSFRGEPHPDNIQHTFQVEKTFQT